MQAYILQQINTPKIFWKACKRLRAAMLWLGAGVLSAGAALAQDQDIAPLPQETIEAAPVVLAYNKVQTYLAGLTSFKAKFRQENPGGNVAQGTLYMARPGRIRFDYTGFTEGASDDGGTVPFLVVGNGETIDFIDYEIGQVTKWPIDDTPLGILIGKKTDLAALGAQIQMRPGGMEGYIALRASDPEKPEMGLITVFFREVDEGVELASWLVEDAQNRITVVEIIDPQHNLELSKSLWQYKDPRGLAKRRTRR